jgi:hypothetical protein
MKAAKVQAQGFREMRILQAEAARDEPSTLLQPFPWFIASVQKFSSHQSIAYQRRAALQFRQLCFAFLNVVNSIRPCTSMVKLVVPYGLLVDVKESMTAPAESQRFF